MYRLTLLVYLNMIDFQVGASKCFIFMYFLQCRQVPAIWHSCE